MTWHCVCALAALQLMFPVLGIDQEASPRGVRNSDSMVTINVFDEVVTPSAALKAMRAVARASGAGEGCSGLVCSAGQVSSLQSLGPPDGTDFQHTTASVPQAGHACRKEEHVH